MCEFLCNNLMAVCSMFVFKGLGILDRMHFWFMLVILVIDICYIFAKNKICDCIFLFIVPLGTENALPI